MPLSPPVTIRTCFFAVSTMATALSTAAWTTSKRPAARPSRWAVEFSVKESSSVTPRLAKIPFATPACRGSALAFGKLLTRTVAGSAVAAADATIARTRIHRCIICPPPSSPWICRNMRVILLFTAGTGVNPAGPIGEFQHACSGKGQSLLATRVHQLPEDQGVPHQERRGLRVDQRARQSRRDGGAAQARRAQRRERSRAAAGMVENHSGPQLLAHDGHLLRQASPARGAGAHRLASGAAHAPADAHSGDAQHQTGSRLDRRGPRGAAASGQGLGRRKGGGVKKILVALAVAALGSGAFAQQRNFDAVQIKTTPVADGIYMLEGEGGNIGVSSGEDGVFLIDDQFAPLTPKILAAVKAISDKPVRFLMNTHWHGDHVGGNENLGKAGVVIIAHDNVYKRMSVGGAIQLLKQNYAPAPKAALPVISFNTTATFHLNGDDVTSIHLPPAHTDGDSLVRFAKANVIHSGDVFAAYRYPFIHPESGGSAKGALRSIDLMLPLVDDNTKVIPGHGGLSGKKDVLAYRKMIATVIGRIEPMAKSGKTLQQVLAAKPTREFDEEWGKFRKPDAFVEIVYNGLAPRRK